MYKAAEQNKQTNLLYENVLALRSAMAEDIEGFKYLNNPLWSFYAKENIIEAFSKKLKFCPTMVNTLKLLAQNRQLDNLLPILNQFIADYQEKHQIAEIRVETAITLSPEQDKKLKEKLAKIFNKKIVINYQINPQILGGLVIQCGTLLIDSSVRNKLNRIEQLMKGTK